MSFFSRFKRQPVDQRTVLLRQLESLRLDWRAFHGRLGITLILLDMHPDLNQFHSSPSAATLLAAIEDERDHLDGIRVDSAELFALAAFESTVLNVLADAKGHTTNGMDTSYLFCLHWLAHCVRDAIERAPADARATRAEYVAAYLSAWTTNEIVPLDVACRWIVEAAGYQL
jgi:hypothetical protein